MTSFGFKKEERLKSKMVIDSLFKEGKSTFVFPIKLVWKEVEGGDYAFPAKAAFTIPKRNFPKAVQRNQIKRKMKEAYRLNKHVFYENAIDRRKQYAMMFIYVGREPLSYIDIEKAIKKILRRIDK